MYPMNKGEGDHQVGRVSKETNKLLIPCGKLRRGGCKVLLGKGLLYLYIRQGRSILTRLTKPSSTDMEVLQNLQILSGRESCWKCNGRSRLPAHQSLQFGFCGEKRIMDND